MAGLPSGAGALVGQRLGKYEILALLALGGTAEIYLARVDGTDGFEKYVVVKCLHDHLAEDPDFVSMFLDEARLGAALDHSNIVQTLGLGQHDDRYYMVMEYITGLSLALVGRRAHERVRGGKVPVPLVLNMAAQACVGLHYAHERTEGGKPLNLVHRDVSPQNLVITFEGIVKVVDFGIAKAEYRETRTRSGTVKGKFAYMSPEQCQAGDVDRRTDVFAMGVIMWELLTGRRLFKRDSTYETYQAVVECAVPPPSSVNHELDPALDGIVMLALGKESARRYPSAEAFGEALMGYLHHRGKPSGPGEIARFFDECFSQEIEDSFVRMRELIEGRRKSVADQKVLQWDSSELDGSAQVLAPEDFELLDDSVSTSRLEQLRARLAVPTPAPASGSVGTVSPPRASISARINTVPERPARSSEPPALPPLVEPVPPDTVDVEDDFDGDPPTDVEAWKNEESSSSDQPRVEASTLAPPVAPVDVATPRRVPTTPPRKTGGMITPPGLRAGGAPLDPLPHEQELIPVPTPPPSQVPPTRHPTSPPRPALFGTASEAAVATVLAPLPGTPRSRAPTAPQPIPGGRFADAPTVHDVSSAPSAPRSVPEPGSKPRFAEVPTVLSAPVPRAPRGFVDAKTVVAPPLTSPTPPRPASEPTVEQTQMLVANDLVEVTPDPAPLPTQPSLPAQDMVSLPALGDVYPGHHYDGQHTVPSGPRNWPPWVLGVMFVIVLAVATGITVAIARAVG